MNNTLTLDAPGLMSFSVPKSLEFFMNLNLTVEERTSVLGDWNARNFVVIKPVML